MFNDGEEFAEKDVFLEKDFNESDNLSEFSGLKFEKEKLNIDDYLESNNTDNFFVSVSNLCMVFMGLINWIMRHTYLIVVAYITILFFIKLGN